jgi:anti-sigma regulatory factor (Ser/Thr protein kinase)
MDTLHTIVVPATTEGLRTAEREFDDFSAAHGLTRNDTWPFNVALDEILSNIVKYGRSGREGDGRVEIRLELQDRVSLEMVIVDDSDPFNPLEAETPDTTLGIEDREVGGLGIEIVRRLMDTIEYARVDDRHNQLTLRRRLGL